jgi:hypothetical protein
MPERFSGRIKRKVVVAIEDSFQRLIRKGDMKTADAGEFEMDGLDFKDLSAREEKLLRDMLLICNYFHLSRHGNVGENVYAAEAQKLGVKFQELQEELKK